MVTKAPPKNNVEVCEIGKKKKQGGASNMQKRRKRDVYYIHAQVPREVGMQIYILIEGKFDSNYIFTIVIF